MAVRKTLAELEASYADSAARKKLVALFDEESFNELDKFTANEIITGCGLVDGACVYAFAGNTEEKSGAISAAVAKKLAKLYALAVKNGSPVVGFFNSNGGDVSEGSALLAAYGEIVGASAKLSGTVPQIAVVDGVCAGIMATVCCMSDFVIMTEKSELFVTPPFVAADGKLAGAGSAMNAAKSGVASIVVKDGSEAVAAAKKLVRILPQNNLETCGNDYYAENDAEITAALKGAAMVTAIADKDSAIELGKDFGSAAYTALASVNWRTVGFVATNKTNNKLTAADCAKIARFVGFCDSFSIPVVTVVDTLGFEASSAAELAGSVRDTAKLAQSYAATTAPKISLITGNAVGSAFIALGKGDFTLSYENAVIAPVSPEAAAVFLHSDKLKGSTVSEIAADYAATEASPFTSLVDRVIDPSETRTAVASALDFTSGKRELMPGKKHVNFVF